MKSRKKINRILDILFFSSNHIIHKSSCGLCFWASDSLIDRFDWNLLIKTLTTNTIWFSLQITVQYCNYVMLMVPIHAGGLFVYITMTQRIIIFYGGDWVNEFVLISSRRWALFMLIYGQLVQKSMFTYVMMWRS